ncbi:oxygenase MpaB family protein [Nocardioides litoris]|uniref:oxygenase MpaB family protein n=1 Tax=Nocardioides litoris TaxID=1926648 RepID=UPI001B87925D|nr:oxygenase MpaB family protein [Nocardioides litoris]
MTDTRRGTRSTPLAPTGLRHVDRAVAEHGQTGRAWLEGMWHADPLADTVVADRAAARVVREALAGADRSGVGAAAGALLDHVTTDPPWLERDRLDRAADVLVRHTAPWGLCLGAASLLRGADNAIAAKPLQLTGRYAAEPAVRSIEVGEWLAEVVRPGGMAVGGPGWVRTVRVRLIHARVRRHVGSSTAWDHDAWGVPVPQPYLAFTLAEFGHVSLEAMTHLGVRLRRRELDDVYHLWRYVGHLIGVEPALLPATEADHVRIEDLYRLTSPGPDDDARLFTRALVEQYLAPQLATLGVGPSAVREAVARRLVNGMTRVFLGSAAADDLGVPGGPLERFAALGVRAAAPGLLVADQSRLLLLGRQRVTRRAYAVREREMDRLRREQGMLHDLVDAVPGAVGHPG